MEINLSAKFGAKRKMEEDLNYKIRREKEIRVCEDLNSMSYDEVYKIVAYGIGIEKHLVTFTLLYEKIIESVFKSRGVTLTKILFKNIKSFKQKVALCITNARRDGVKFYYYNAPMGGYNFMSIDANNFEDFQEQYYKQRDYNRLSQVCIGLYCKDTFWEELQELGEITWTGKIITKKYGEIKREGYKMEGLEKTYLKYINKI